MAFAEVEGDGVLALEHGLVGCFLVEDGGAHAEGKDLKAADGDGDAVGAEGDTAVSCGGEEAAPVGVGA